MNRLDDEEILKNPHELTNLKSLETLWIPLLGVLTGLCGDIRQKIQEKSLESLFLILY